MNSYWLATFASALLSMMNPVGNAGIFASMTEASDYFHSRTIAWKCALAVFIILMVSTWAGSWALGMAGINVHELRAAGGVIVLLIGLKMLFNDKSHEQTASEAASSRQQASVAVVPLAIPIVAGPGTISLVIATAGDHPLLKERLLISIICLLMATFIGVVFSGGKKIARFLGVSGMAVVTRVMGMVLSSIAIGMLASGVRGLFPEIFVSQ